MKSWRVLVILGLAGALSAPGPASAQLVFATDHFKCYPVLRASPANEFVELEDQFDKAEDLREQVLVDYPRLFCNPVEKTEPTGAVTPIKNINNHLKLYTIHPAATQLTGLPAPLTRAVVVENQFGLQSLRVTNPIVLAVPAQKRPHDAPSGLDHFKCYPARSEEPVDRTVTLKDQFDSQPVPAQVLRAVLFCNPTVKGHDDQVVPIRNPDDHLTCYGILTGPVAGAAAPQLTRVVQVRDQFLRDRIVLRNPRYLCVPSFKRGHTP